MCKLKKHSLDIFILCFGFIFWGERFPKTKLRGALKAGLYESEFYDNLPTNV